MKVVCSTQMLYCSLQPGTPLTLKVGFLCPFVVIAPTDLGATTELLFPALCFPSSTYPRRIIPAFSPMVIKLACLSVYSIKWKLFDTPQPSRYAHFICLMRQSRASWWQRWEWWRCGDMDRVLTWPLLTQGTISKPGQAASWVMIQVRFHCHC